MVTALAFAVLLQQPPQGPQQIKPMTVQTTAGDAVKVPDEKAKLTLLVFMYSDCPISNRYAPELQRIEREYREKGVKAYRVYAYAGATKEEIAQHTKDFGFQFPAVHDKAHLLVKAVGATVSPEAAVLAPDGKILYRGRIDDSYVDHGRLREGDYRRDLRIALDEALAGQPVTLPRATALGCIIQ